MKTLKDIPKPIYILVLLLAILLNYYLSRFEIYGSKGYLLFLANNSPFISLGFAFFSLVWKDIDNRKKLTSSNPQEYIIGYVEIFMDMVLSMALLSARSSLVGVSIDGEGETLATQNPEREFEMGQGQKANSKPNIEYFRAILVMGSLVLLFLAWSLAIAPLMYFLILITGAPARSFIRAPKQIGITIQNDRKSEKKEYISFFENNPVSATFTVSSIFLWVFKTIIT